MNITRRRQTPPDLAKLKSHICHAVKALYTKLLLKFHLFLTGCIVDISLIFSPQISSPQITHVNKDNFFFLRRWMSTPAHWLLLSAPSVVISLFLGVVGSVVVCVSLVFLLTVNKMMMINEQKTNKQTRVMIFYQNGPTKLGLILWPSSAPTSFLLFLHLNPTPGDNGGASFKNQFPAYSSRVAIGGG